MESTPPERQFTQAVANVLISQGFKVSVGEIIMPGNIAADIVARKESRAMAVETALTPEKIRSAISKAAYMRLLPPITESYIAVPHSLIKNDVNRYANTVGVEIFSVVENQIVSTYGAQRVAVNLGLQYGYPKNVVKGQEFTVLVTIVNQGEKMGWQLKVSCEIAYPFVNPSTGRSEATLESLSSGEEKQVALSLRVDPGAVPGIYPIFIRVEGPGFEPYVSAIQVIVS